MVKKPAWSASMAVIESGAWGEGEQADDRIEKHCRWNVSAPVSTSRTRMDPDALQELADLSAGTRLAQPVVVQTRWW